MNIILTGMMGSGKTTTALQLAKLTNYKFVDIDLEIEKSLKMKISDIFLNKGEQFFRTLESQKIKELCYNIENKIIALGGGAFEDEGNRKVLTNNGIIIYLKTSADEIFKRIENETEKRPLLKKDFSVEKIIFLLEKRKRNYEKAHIIINTTNKTPYNIAKEILGVINDRGKNSIN